MTPRLHLPREHAPDAAAGARIAVDGDRAHYLLRVLRLRVGDAVQLFDGEGTRRGARLVEARRSSCTLELDAAAPPADPSPLRLVLLQGISAAEKMDWTIEKAVELGVDVIVPVQADRAQVRLDAARAAKRHEHWQRLIVAACMQCGRDRLPELLPAQPLGPALQSASVRTARHLLLLHPPGGDPPAEPLSGWTPPRETPGPHGTATPPRAPLGIVLLAGPESGWSAAEVATAVAAGARPVVLGPRVLRTETAALAAVAALQVRYGEF